MKKVVSLLLLVVISITFFACNKDDGDLGKQTTVNKDNGYTLVQEVKPFKFSDEEDELENIKGIRTEGFKVTQENAKGAIKTKADVIEIAQQEASSDYNQIQVFFDRTTGIWKAVFSVTTATTAEDGTVTRDSVIKETVYIDEDGYTLLAFKQ
ncbi:MAG: hypothetical protein J6K64_01785 [Clostridia bacterium]|nr:hypothetical protein [Clostridia bacterium]